MTLLSNSQTDGDVSLEPVPMLMTSSAYSMSGMAAVGGFGAAPSLSVASAPVDTSSRRSSTKQRRRSSNIIRAPIASAEELSPSSPQGFTPSGSEGPGHQPPVDSKSLDGDKSVFRSPRHERGIKTMTGLEGPAVYGLPDDSKSFDDDKSPFRSPRDEPEQAARNVKTKTPHISTFADSRDGIPSQNAAVSAASETKLSSYKPASKLGKSTSSYAPAVSAHSQSYVTDNSLPSTLPSVPGAVRRPDSFVHAMSEQLVASEPRRGRGARPPSLETQPEEELSYIYEFSV